MSSADCSKAYGACVLGCEGRKAVRGCYKKSWARVRLILLKAAALWAHLWARDSICRKPSAVAGPLTRLARQPSTTVSCSAPGVSARAVNANVPIAPAACSSNICVYQTRFP